MKYLIGLGHELKDISIKGIEACKESDKVFLESYTSLSNFKIEELETLIGKKVHILDRSDVEEKRPFTDKSALLIYGDPLSATTHKDIISKKTKIIHAPSIFTSIAETGLELYKFGKTLSVTFWSENYKPESFYDYIEQNQSIDAHTLMLLDLDPINNKFLSIQEALEQILSISKKRKSFINEDTKFILCARIGMNDSVIKYSSYKEIKNFDFGKAPFCIVLPGKLSFVEKELLTKLD